MSTGNARHRTGTLILRGAKPQHQDFSLLPGEIHVNAIGDRVWIRAYDSTGSQVGLSLNAEQWEDIKRVEIDPAALEPNEAPFEFEAWERELFTIGNAQIEENFDDWYERNYA